MASKLALLNSSSNDDPSTDTEAQAAEQFSLDLSDEGVKNLQERIKEGGKFDMLLHNLSTAYEKAQSFISDLNLPKNILEDKKRILAQVEASIPVARIVVDAFLNGFTTSGLKDIVKFIIQSGLNCVHIMNWRNTLCGGDPDSALVSIDDETDDTVTDCLVNRFLNWLTDNPPQPDPPQPDPDPSQPDPPQSDPPQPDPPQPDPSQPDPSQPDPPQPDPPPDFPNEVASACLKALILAAEIIVPSLIGAGMARGATAAAVAASTAGSVVTCAGGVIAAGAIICLLFKLYQKR